MISTEDRRHSFNGDDATVAFAFTFPVFSIADIKVVHRTALEVDTVLSEGDGADYTVALSGSPAGSTGGVVTTEGTLSPPASGEILSIILDPAMKQEQDLGAGSAVNPQIMEDSLDKVTNISKRTRDIAERALGIADGGQVGDNWDANSKRIKNVTDPTSATDAATKGWVEATYSGISTDVFAGMVFPVDTVGDGVTDDTVAFQAALTAAIGKTLYLEPGAVYLCGALTINPEANGITIEGNGATIKTLSSLGINEQGMLNATISSYTDFDVTFRNLIFDGNNVGAGGAFTRLAALVSMNHVTRLNFENVRVTNIQGIGCEIGGCHDVVVDRCEFDNCGYEGAVADTTLTVDEVSGSGTELDPSLADISSHDWDGAGFEAGIAIKLFSSDNNNSAPCVVDSLDVDGVTLHISSETNALFDSGGPVSMRVQSFSDSAGAPLRCARGSAGDCERVRIVNCNFHDNQWSNHFSMVDSVIDGNCFSNEGEGHLFLADHYDGVTKMKRTVVSNNVLETVFTRNISGSGMEVSGTELTFTGNKIKNCPHPGLSLGAPDNCIVIGNTFANCGLEVGPTLWPGIRVYDDVNSEPVKNTLIEANFFYDDQAVPTMDYSVRVDGVQPFESLVLKGNMEGDGLVVGGIKVISSGAFPWNDSCKIIDHVTAAGITNSIQQLSNDGEPLYYDGEPLEYNVHPT